MKRLIITVFTLLIFTAGCIPKEIEKPTTDSGQTPDPNTYMPVHKGSTWTYYFYMRGQTDIINNPVVGNKTVTMTGDSIIKLGVTYYKASAVTNKYTNNVYFSKTGSIYVMNDDDTKTFAPTLSDLPCLDESNPAGYRTTIGVTPAIGPGAIYISTLMTKNLNHLLNGIMYENTIHVYNQQNVDVGTGNAAQSTNTIDYYFAKGVGLISMTVTYQNARVLEISLIKCSIK